LKQLVLVVDKTNLIFDRTSYIFLPLLPFESTELKEFHGVTAVPLHKNLLLHTRLKQQ